MKNICIVQHRSPERNTRELKCGYQKKFLTPKDFLAEQVSRCADKQFSKFVPITAEKVHFSLLQGSQKIPSK